MKAIGVKPNAALGVSILAIILVNLAGAGWAFFGNVNFIASNLALMVGATYAVASGAALWRLARIARIPNAVGALAIGVFGFFFISHAAAHAYTSTFGSTATVSYTVSSSYDAGNRDPCRQQFRHHLSGVLWLAVSGNVACASQPWPVGTRINVVGPTSELGQVANRTYLANGF